MAVIWIPEHDVSVGVKKIYLIADLGLLRAPRSKQWSVMNIFTLLSTSVWTLSTNSNPPKFHHHYLYFLAINGAMDNSFFVFSGMALAAGGPASLLISEVLAQIVTYCATESLSEMNSFQPAGSFINFTYLYLDPAWSFAVGWIYAIRSMISISFAVASTARLLNVYLPSLGISTWVGILLSCILVFMFVQTKIMAQLAAIAGVTKALGLLGFTTLGIITSTSSRSHQGREGYNNWVKPGAFNNGVFGWASVVVFSAARSSGLDLMSLGALESTRSPEGVSMAAKYSFWTLTALRLLSALATGLEAPYTDLRLISASNYPDAAASPISIVMVDRNTPEIAFRFLQGLVVLTQLSVALSLVFGGSRAITSLAWQNQAPKFCTLRDRSGRPVMSLGIAAIVALLGFISTSDLFPVLYAWLIGVGGPAALFVQTSIFVAHIRFRNGLRKQGHSLSSLSHRYLLALVRSWMGIFFNLLVFACQIWTGIGPMGFSEMLSEKVIGSEFATYIYIPAVIVLYGVYKLWCPTRWRRSLEMEFTVDRATSNG